ncbi:2'-5' RNA ligase family protein [Paenisporosarcina sp. TG20]|uniref:2'-5' RNA ligase family protein n=1 Tax=Paenisporosarcina sp. TG20 TaxID=1211706 RepID=UPI0002E3A90F|nr:2'-5' RNA ligase family protein [Paenisporosarcina sp. TG20]
MYGVIAIFDEKTEKVITEIWQELREKEISFYAYEVENRRPHITLASYHDINQTNYIKHMDKIYHDSPSINITFNAIGSFLNSGALFYSPTVTRELIELHTNHHKNFERFNDDPNSMYLPDKWIPHCTLANRLSSEKLLAAFNYCSKRSGTINGKITEIAIIDVSQQNKAPIIYSKKLKEVHY